MQDLAARKALIIKLSNNYDWSASNFTKGQLDAMVEATAGCSLEALQRSVGQFMAGLVEEHNNAKMPSGGQLAANARQWDYALSTVDADRPRLVSYPMGSLPPKPMVPGGMISIDFGKGPIDMTRLTYAEQQEVMKTKTAPTRLIAGRVEQPKLQRMGK